MNANAARSLDSWNTYLGPTKGYVEQVYLLEALGDENSSTMAFGQSETLIWPPPSAGMSLNFPT